MKRHTKIWLIIALVFALAGGGLCIAAVSMGIDRSDVRRMIDDGRFSLVLRRVNTVTDSNRRNKDSYGEYTDFSERFSASPDEERDWLEIDLDYGNLTIKTASSGDEIYMDVGEYDDYFRWSVDDNGIRVENRDEDWQIFDFNMPKATLYLPENCKFSNIYIDIDAGSCSVETPLSCEYLEMDVDAGNAAVQNIQSDIVNLDCDAGKIEFNGQVTGDGAAQVDAGKIMIQLTNADERDYNYNVDVSAGSLSINSQSFNGLEDRRYIDNQSDKEWTLECNAGKIDMKITK